MLMLSGGSALLAATLSAATPERPDSSTMVVVVVLIAVFIWLASLWLHPFRHCAKCNSVPRTYGGIFKGSFSICSRCGGNGREKRFMANVWAKNRPL